MSLMKVAGEVILGGQARLDGYPNKNHRVHLDCCLSTLVTCNEHVDFKLIYIACSYATVYLIYMKFKATYDGNHDTFRVEFLVVPVGGLSFLVNHDFSPLEILWTFSIYLESVAILPQLFMISKTGEAETITTHYLFFLGLYRALYLINWIWRYYFEGFFDLIAVVAGVVQTILYCDFFYFTQRKEAQFASVSAKTQSSASVILDA
ncbi:UNVERIFIED_CONTAM: ER lumen protein-retaining receptor 2 [Gekko kuhli]